MYIAIKNGIFSTILYKNQPLGNGWHIIFLIIFFYLKYIQYI